jgi:hypothetical protein
MTKKATGAASPARIAEALVKAKARAQAEREAEAESSRARDMFEKDLWRYPLNRLAAASWYEH